MSSISREQRETLAIIDAILAMTEKIPKDDLVIGANISLNPFDFLMEIIMKKVSFDEMLDWLVNILTKSLPTIELGVKGALLANLKATIDCNNDPRIPNWIRNEGMSFNLQCIDYKNIMSVSPLSEHGNFHYFGTNTYYIIDGDKDENKKYFNNHLAYQSCVKQGIPISNVRKITECDNVYQLARANDFNAFLWFVVHKGHFPFNVSLTDLGKEEKDIFGIIEGSESLGKDEQPLCSPRSLCYK